MKQVYLFLFILFTTNIIFSQNNYQIKTVAFYNLENLFDTENDTLKNDEASPIMEIKENRGAIYQKKLDNMAKVLSEIGYKDTKNSPVILGVVEIENRKVLEDLVNTEALAPFMYQIVHFNSPDVNLCLLLCLISTMYNFLFIPIPALTS